ncbi:MAG TPA: hypothetical protein VJ455_04910 [Ignavibacteria bacterium]|nr:hypothetical protein [Ignavibacteria bacterium]
MFIRALVFSLLLLAGSAGTVSVSNAAQSSSVQLTYTYERVQINNVWWIFVYGEDGTLIDNYPDPVQ